MGYKVAVVGATGNVGREMLNILAEREFPADEVVALASKHSGGKDISFGEKDILKVQELDGYDFAGTDIALFSAGSEISKIYAPIAAEAGCIVIDNSSYFRMKDNIPLVVPEVNPEDLSKYKETNIIANPNCSTIQMVVALKPLDDLAGIKRVVVSTYQSVSGAGKEAMDELYNQTKSLYMFGEIAPRKFTKQIAFNLIPHIDSFLDDGSTKEEWKMINETKKIMHPGIELSVTCVRVPVYVGHSLSLNIELHDEFFEGDIFDLYSEAPGIMLFDRREDGGYITPIESAQEDSVFISRIRRDLSVKNGLNMWVVTDNLRKGAALNAVQIAEELVKNFI